MNKKRTLTDAGLVLIGLAIVLAFALGMIAGARVQAGVEKVVQIPAERR